MNKEELITNKINSLKCRGKYNLDIKDSISNMLSNFAKLKHKILKGNYKVIECKSSRQANIWRNLIIKKIEESENDNC